MAPRLPEEELYDTVADPHEIVNLAASPAAEHRRALERLRTALAVWMVETRDRGHIPEPPEVIRRQEREMHEWFGTPSWAEPPR